MEQSYGYSSKKFHVYKNIFLSPISEKTCKISEFMFSKKATKIDEIFTYVVSVKSTVKILSIFVAFLENTNFTLYYWIIRYAKNLP